MYEKPVLYKHLDFMILDIVTLELCYVLAYYIRHHRGFSVRESSSYAAVLFLIVLMELVSGILFRNYKEIISRGYLKELGSVMEHVSIVTAGLIFYLFAVRDQGMFSRLVLGYFYVISIPVLYVVRVSWKAFLRKKNTTGYSRRRAILLTAPDIPRDRIEKLKEDLSSLVEISGVVVSEGVKPEDSGGKDWENSPENAGDLKTGGLKAGDPGAGGLKAEASEAGGLKAEAPEAGDLKGSSLSAETYCGIPVLGTYDTLADSVRSQWVDEVFVLLGSEEEEQERDVLKELSIMGITLHFVMSAGHTGERVRFVETVGDTVFLTESIRAVTFGQMLAKRILDIIGALVGLLFTGIFTVIFGPAIFFTDPGPIFYSQQRVGRNGRVFRMYKFRSMYKDADRRKQELMKHNEMNGLMFKMKNDPRILGSGPDGTKHGIGWLLRTTSIDEFPQFLNVLLGQLSLVGTRPPTVDEWKQYESHHRARMAVKPGITGLWQVSGRNKVTDFEDVVKLDMEYIENFSIRNDLKILLKTIKVVLKHEGAE